MSQPQIDPVLLTEESTSANKRKELLAEGVASTLPRKKKLKTTGSAIDFDKAKYELVGRKLACLLHPFGSPRTAINVGLKVESGREGELDLDSLEIERHHRFYDAVLSHALGLAEELSNRMEANELQNICAWITKGMSDQRSTDLGSVKHAGLAYLLANGKPLEPSITKSEDKSMRGFNHPQIARMLCPRKKLEVFDEDPDTIIGALQDGTIRTTAANWPTCFYEDGVYDPENRAKGLFCGHAAFRFYTHLFIGPSAASTDTVISSSSKVSKNRAWGLTEVTPSIIAYIHVVLYFTLSTAPRWCTTIGQMDLAEMAWSIIELFDEKDDWTKETLAWWNSRAFPKGHGCFNNLDSDDDMANIRAQRARLSKKATHPSRLEIRAAEAIEFATPPPETTSIPSSEDPGNETQPHSSVSVSSIFSATTAALIDSDLSPCTSDNEAESTQMPAAHKTTDSAVASTSTAPAPSSHLSTSPVEPKKGRALATKKPRRRGGKKSNGF